MPRPSSWSSPPAQRRQRASALIGGERFDEDQCGGGECCPSGASRSAKTRLPCCRERQEQPEPRTNVMSRWEMRDRGALRRLSGATQRASPDTETSCTNAIKHNFSFVVSRFRGSVVSWRAGLVRCVPPNCIRLRARQLTAEEARVEPLLPLRLDAWQLRRPRRRIREIHSGVNLLAVRVREHRDDPGCRLVDAEQQRVLGHARPVRLDETGQAQVAARRPSVAPERRRPRRADRSACPTRSTPAPRRYSSRGTSSRADRESGRDRD